VSSSYDLHRAWAAVAALVLSRRVDAQRLAEVLLVDPDHRAVVLADPVVAGDDDGTFVTEGHHL
jgi:hypothetical protein